MLTTIDKTVKFRSLVPMNTKQNKEYYRELDAILHHYNQAGFMIKTIHCNGECKAMMDQVRDDLDVVMNYTNASNHGTRSQVKQQNHQGENQGSIP